MKEIFSKNLKSARAAKGWNQEKAATAVGVKMCAYAAWEEARAFPRVSDLINIARVFRISDLVGFISNPKFALKQQIQQAPKQDDLVPAAALVEQRYREAGIKEKLAVNILLGLVEVDEN